jgi:hypothetical protein
MDDAGKKTRQDLEAKIHNLLRKRTETTDEAVSLRYEFEVLGREYGFTFMQLAELWAEPLYDRNPDAFRPLINQYVEQKNADVLRRILDKARLSGDLETIRQFGRSLLSDEEWNADVLAIVRNVGSTGEEIDRATALLQAYHFYQHTLTPETALDVYESGLRTSREFVSQHLYNPTGDYGDLLRTMIERKDRGRWLEVFRKVATEAQWRDELAALLQQDIPANKIDQRLREISLHYRHQLPDEVWQPYIDKYGEAVMPYLWHTHTNFMRRRIEELLNSNLSNPALLEEFNAVANGDSYRFLLLAKLWGVPLYERGELFDMFLVGRLRHWGNSKPIEVIDAILERAERDRRMELFNGLYRQVLTPDRWNQDLLKLAQSDLPDEEVQARIAVRTSFSSNYRLYLPVAQALYNRNPDMFGIFVAQRVMDGAGAEQFRAAVRKRGDDETYWSLFRETANEKEWLAEMESLLQRDIPAERINAELEKRHPNNPHSKDPQILLQFLEKYGEAVMPYFERHINMVTRERIEMLLRMQPDRAVLLRELERMARQQRDEFRALSDVWAMPLYKRDPVFFESFLARHLENNFKVIKELMPLVEANKHDALFRSLYRKVADEAQWNRELHTLAKSKAPDAEVFEHVLRREPNSWWTLNEDVAMDLYRRNPTLSRDYLRRHTGSRRWSWRGQEASQLQKLRKMVHDRKDMDLYWDLFKRFASPGEWDSELKDLLRKDIPADRIVDEINRRLPDQGFWSNYRPTILFDFLKKYGAIIMPIIRKNFPLLARERSDALDIVRSLVSEGEYWELFFTLQNDHMWNEALRHMIDNTMDNETLLKRLTMMSPQEESTRWRRWHLNSELALKLYRREPERARPFIERYLGQPSDDLLNAAQARKDDEFLDFLTYRYMGAIAQKIYQAYPPDRVWRWNRPDAKAREFIEDTGKTFAKRFHDIYAKSPQEYVQHAANVLSRMRAFEIWDIRQQSSHNPIFIYLTTRHREAWRESAAGILELMESPNIYVQIMALDILADIRAEIHTEVNQTSPAIVDRVCENLHMLRALLLSRSRRNTKKKALAVLNNAVNVAITHGKFTEAAEILGAMDDTMDYKGRRAIGDMIMASYVRGTTKLQRALQSNAAQPTKLEGVR